MLLLQLLTFTLVVSYSLGFGVNYIWNSWEKSSSDDFTSEEYHYDPERYWKPTPRALIHRIAAFTKTETPPQNCPTGESLMSKRDIIVLVNYLQLESKIIHNINNSYIPDAGKVRDKHLHSIKELETRLETRPEHLEHILEDIDVTRMKLEPIVDELVSKLQDYKMYDDQFLNVNKRVQKLLEVLEKYKQLCKYNNCNEKKLVKRQNNNPLKLTPTVTDEDYYCTSLEDLHKRIISNLTHFQTDYEAFIRNRLNTDDKVYATKINNITMNVKESAISMFGVTMYDILSLQDDYHDYADYLNIGTNITAEFNTIKMNIFELEYKLSDLEKGVANYQQYCLYCNPLDKIRKLHFWNPSKNKPENLINELESSTSLPRASNEANSDIKPPLNIDKLITDQINSFKQVIDNDYINIFAALNNVVNNASLIDSYVKKLKPVQEKVKNELAVKEKALISLKNKLPQSKVDQVFELSNKSKDLLVTVQSAIDFVNKYA